MNSKPIVRTTLLVLLAASLLWAGEPWKEKPYTEWTEDEVKKILKDSPWAQKVKSYKMGNRVVVNQRPSYATTRSAGNPRTGSFEGTTSGRASIGHSTRTAKTVVVAPNPTEETIPVVLESHAFELLWFSALTVRQGIVRRRLLEGTLTEKEGERLLAFGPDHYVIALAGLGIYSLSTVPEKEFRSASLQTRKGKKVIPLERYFRGVKESGALTQVLFYFPREWKGAATLEPGETRVTFLLKTQAGRIEAKFNLKQMVRGGAPDI